LDAVSNHLHLRGNDRRAQIALQLFLALCLVVKVAPMFCLISVLTAEILLTLTANTCKCELYTALRMLAATRHLRL